MKQFGLILLIAGLALTVSGLLLQCLPAKVVSTADHSLHDTLYLIPHLHTFVLIGLPLALSGAALAWFKRKSNRLDPLRALAFGLLIAAALSFIVGYTQNEATMRALDDQSALLSYLPVLEPVVGALLGIAGLSLLALSRLIQLVNRIDQKTKRKEIAPPPKS